MVDISIRLSERELITFVLYHIRFASKVPAESSIQMYWSVITRLFAECQWEAYILVRFRLLPPYRTVGGNMKNDRVIEVLSLAMSLDKPLPNSTISASVPASILLVGKCEVFRQ